MKNIMSFIFFIIPFFSEGKEIIHFTQLNKKIYINNITINGEHISGNFLIDTGSDVTIINSKIIQVNRSANINKPVYSYYGKMNAYVIPTQLNLGSINFGSVDIYYVEGGYIFTENCIVDDISGIIGRDILDKAHWKFDMKNKKLEVSNEKFETSSFLSVPIHRKGKYDKIFLKIKHNNKEEEVMLDTGSDVGISIKKRHIFPDRVSVFGSQIDRIVEKNDSICIQGVSFLTNILYSERLKPSIGIGFLSDFMWILEKDGNYIHILQQDKYQIKKNIQKYGFSVMISQDKLIVSDVYINSIAYKNGVRVFDEILEINSISTTAPNCDLLNIIENEFLNEEMILKIKTNKIISLKKIYLNPKQ